MSMVLRCGESAAARTVEVTGGRLGEVREEVIAIRQVAACEQRVRGAANL